MRRLRAILSSACLIVSLAGPAALAACCSPQSVHACCAAKVSTRALLDRAPCCNPGELREGALTHALVAPERRAPVSPAVAAPIAVADSRRRRAIPRGVALERRIALAAGPPLRLRI
jgi:hypothetical protein